MFKKRDFAQARVDGGTTAEGMDALALRYRSPLIRYFLRRRLDRHSVEDLVHEVFVRLAQRDLRGIDNPEAYLFATAASVVLDRARRAKTRCENEHDPIENFELVSGVPSPARVFESKETLVRLAAILDELPQRTREIFLLSRLDRLTNTQLAARYGIGVGAIEKHMTKALAHLRARFAADE